MSSMDLQSPQFRRHKSSATINHLPNETLLHIFEYLNMKDLIRSRLVCKRFMLLCDSVRVPEVIISNKIENVRGHWFYTNRKFNHGDDAITLSTFTAYRSKFQLEKFVKRLYFRGDYLDYKQLRLNNFTELEELSLVFFRSMNMRTISSYLNLPNLKIFEYEEHDFELKFVLKTPKLQKFKCIELSDISLAHPDTIDHLEVLCYSDGLNHFSYSLSNVQYLKMERGMPKNLNILAQFPKLKTFICNEFVPCRIEDSLTMARHLVEQKRILKRSDLRIYYQSVEMVDRHKIDECMLANSTLEFQMNNYSALCDIVCYDFVFDYKDLVDLNKNSLPEDFFKKNREIEIVNVAGEVNQEHLVQFLNRLEYLRRIYLNDVSLDQRFFDGLHKITQLTDLHIENTSTIIVSYHFLLKLKLLETFVIDQDSFELFDTSLALFKELKYFEKISFVDGNERITICRDLNSNDYSFNRLPLSKGLHAYVIPQYLLKKRIEFEQLCCFVDDHKNVKLFNDLCRGIDFTQLPHSANDQVYH